MTGVNHKRTVLRDLKAVNPVVGNLNLAEVSSRMNNELLLNVSAIRGDFDIHTIPSIVVDNPAEGFNVGVPLCGIVPDKIVVFPRLNACGFDRGGGMRSYEVFGKNKALEFVGSGNALDSRNCSSRLGSLRVGLRTQIIERYSVVGQPEYLPSGFQLKLDALVPLALVLDKARTNCPDVGDLTARSEGL